MKKHLIFLFILSASSNHTWGQPQGALQKHNGAEHEHIAPSHLLHKNESRNNTDQETIAIARLTHILHHAIESEHGHSIKEFLQAFKSKEQWMRTLNFQNIARRTVRAFNMESNKTHLKNHVKNLALLFPISHFIEVLTAPTFMAIGTVHEFPAVVIGLGGSLLSLIAVPGLDPLCILLLLSYPLKPVHRSIDAIRSLSERSLSGLITTLKLDALLSKTYKYEDRLSFIKQSIENHQLLDVELQTSQGEKKLSLFSRTTGSRILSLKSLWDSTENRFYIQSVWLSSFAPSQIPKGVFNLFPWNARSAVREVLTLLKAPEKRKAYEREFFVDRISISSEQEMEVFFKNRAIYLSERLQMKGISKSHQQSPCKNSFL